MNLYDLTGQYARLQELAEEGEDVSEALALLGDALADKGLAIAYVIKNLGAEAEAVGAEAARLAEKKRALESNLQRLKTYVKTAMMQAGVSKLRAGALSISVYDGPERVEILDEAAIPETYQRIRTEPNKAAILDAYKTTGEVICGTRIDRSVCLRIR